MKDLGHLYYFVAIVVTCSPESISVSQQKCIFDLLKESSMMDFWLIGTPIELAVRFHQNLGDALEDLDRYGRLIGKLINLIVTGLDITFLIRVLS